MQNGRTQQDWQASSSAKLGFAVSVDLLGCLHKQSTLVGWLGDLFACADHPGGLVVLVRGGRCNSGDGSSGPLRNWTQAL